MYIVVNHGWGLSQHTTFQVQELSFKGNPITWSAVGYAHICASLSNKKLQNNPVCRLKLLVEKIGHYYYHATKELLRYPKFLNQQIRFGAYKSLGIRIIRSSMQCLTG